ncbi:MAG: UDP-N-acetylmuramoyl-L-alanyl-D-glutamate--2,6-diaminopimelate ligase [Pseudomonadota bacterium]
MPAQRYPDSGQDLQRLFAGLVDPARLPDVRVSGLALDSRRVRPGELFLACAGRGAHGASFIPEALANGAVAVALEPNGAPEVTAPVPVPMFAVEGLGKRVSEVAGRFYGEPSAGVSVVGITGTNGKTSVSQFIAQSLDGEAPCGVIGTLGSGLYGELAETGHTTPDAVTLQQQLAQMRRSGARYVAMEVSSHALDQGRVEAVHFAVAVFTNLSHEHLDYHEDMSRYAAAKHRLLEMPGLRCAVINADDATGAAWLADLPAGVAAIDYGLEPANDDRPTLYADALELGSDGLSMQVHYAGQKQQLATALLGRFNASNLLAALGALLALGVEFDDALARLQAVRTVPGRMEAFGGGDKPLVVVDYAHTPDALEHVLRALREHTRKRLWCLFGCGGERDQQKRPLMGRIAERLADSVVLTDDNPRGEDPYNIIEAIIAGTKNPDAIYVKRNRAEAIALVIALARPGDVVLIAGKGHEDVQQLAGESIRFSDRHEVARLLGEEVSGA